MADAVSTAIYRLGLDDRDYQTAAKRVEAASTKLADSFSRIEARADPAEAAARKLAAGILAVERARESGEGGAERQAAALARLTQNYDRQIAFLNRGATSARGFGSAVQQAGFQVGDFAVQVASGQNPLRAFIQQGTQLISMFGPWGAVIGAAGAVVGALAVSFFDLGENTKKASDAQEDFNKSLEAAEKLMDRINGKTEETKEALLAQRQVLLMNAEAALQFAESRLSGMSEFEVSVDPHGLETVTRTPGFQEQQAEVKRLRDELILLRGTLGDFPDAWSRISESAAAANTNVAASTGTTTKAIVEQHDAVQSLLDSFRKTDINDFAHQEAQLELAFERGTISLANYNAEMAKLYNTLGAAPKADNFAPGGLSSGSIAGSIEAANDATLQWGASLEQVARSGARSLLDIATGATTAEDALNRLLNQMLEVSAEAALNGLLGYLPSLFSGGPSISSFGGSGFIGPIAKGAAFDRSGVMPFARGGVVATPTFFPMANGGTGLMGEAGPEAVMPLRRGPDGRLGVAAAGSGQAPVIINVNNYGEPIQAQQEQRRGPRGEQIVDVTIGKAGAKDIQSGGPMSRALEATYGLRRGGGARG